MIKRPPVEDRTILEHFAWSYAIMTMVYASRRHGGDNYIQSDHIVRNKNYHGLLKGKLDVGSLLIDERSKHRSISRCSYCFTEGDQTIDDLIPQLRGGSHEAYNLVMCCRSCNSSKSGKDFLEWTQSRFPYPPIKPLRRYMKLLWNRCMEMDLLHHPLTAVPDFSDDFPFKLSLLQDEEPDLSQIVPVQTTTSIREVDGVGSRYFTFSGMGLIGLGTAFLNGVSNIRDDDWCGRERQSGFRHPQSGR